MPGARHFQSLRLCFERRVHGHNAWPLLARPVLFGLSLVWRAAARAHRLLYTQLLPDVFSSRLPVPLVISVGNVSVGGTGKTPMVEFIGRTLANGNEPKSFGSDCMILMRGYGRDEEFELKANLPAAKIVAGSNRAQLAQEALCESATSSDNVSTIILDDGLQHFQLKRDLNVVMVNALRGCAGAYAHTLPYGALREPWASGLARADAVVLHHATSVSAQGLVALRDALAKIQPDLRFFASEMRPVSLYQGEMPSRIICLTGVGCPESVERMAQRVFARGGKTPEIEMCVFGDHHAFDVKELTAVRAAAHRKSALVVTTAKDYHRTPDLFHQIFHENDLFVMRARLELIDQDAVDAFTALVQAKKRKEEKRKEKSNSK